MKTKNDTDSIVRDMMETKCRALPVNLEVHLYVVARSHLHDIQKKIERLKAFIT